MAALPWDLARRRTITVPAQLKMFSPGGQRLGERREPRRRLFDGLSLEVDNAPSPVRGLWGREGDNVHGALLCAVACLQAIGGPTITSRPAAARDRMIGHEGSNSERRTLNFADRGCA